MSNFNHLADTHKAVYDVKLEIYNQINKLRVARVNDMMSGGINGDFTNKINELEAQADILSNAQAIICDVMVNTL